MLKNSVRVIGGQWRGRQVAFNPKANIRPTPDRVRETLFNWLMGQTAEARCLDLFAGSGILGLEALSRGARFLLSIDNSSENTNGLKQALKKLQADTSSWQVIQADALTWLQTNPSTAGSGIGPFDIIFIDPPYAAQHWAKCLDLIQTQGWLAPDGIIYLESDQPLEDLIAATRFTILKAKKLSRVYAYLIVG